MSSITQYLECNIQQDHRFLEILIVVATQRVQYVYSIAAIGDPVSVLKIDWFVVLERYLVT